MKIKSKVGDRVTFKNRVGVYCIDKKPENIYGIITWIDEVKDSIWIDILNEIFLEKSYSSGVRVGWMFCDEDISFVVVLKKGTKRYDKAFTKAGKLRKHQE